MEHNQTVIGGRVTEVAPLRYTPAGIAVTELKLSHGSRQTEADRPRDVTCEIPVIAMGKLAETAAAIQTGTGIVVKGFLAKRSYKNTQLVLHVSQIKII